MTALREAVPARSRPLPLAGIFLMTMTPQAAVAGRVLEEAPTAAKVVDTAPRPELDRALKSTTLVEQCPRDGLRQADLSGVRCRAALSAAILRARGLAKPADLKARTSLFADLSRTAASVSSWEPLSPPPGFGRARFDAHLALSGALMALYDEITAAKDRGPLARDAAAWLAAGPDPKSLACQAAQRSVELATGADASAEERGTAQALLTSHACFLDESRLRGAPRAAAGPRQDAGETVTNTSADDKIQSYAATRSMDLERCTKHLDAAGAPADSAKLEKCACGAIGRWKLPATGQAASTSLPVSVRVGVQVDVAANGAVSRCGPLSVKR